MDRGHLPSAGSSCQDRGLHDGKGAKVDSMRSLVEASLGTDVSPELAANQDPQLSTVLD